MYVCILYSVCCTRVRIFFAGQITTDDKPILARYTLARLYIIRQRWKLFLYSIRKILGFFFSIDRKLTPQQV